MFILCFFWVFGSRRYDAIEPVGSLGSSQSTCEVWEVKKCWARSYECVSALPRSYAALVMVWKEQLAGNCCPQPCSLPKHCFPQQWHTTCLSETLVHPQGLPKPKQELHTHNCTVGDVEPLEVIDPNTGVDFQAVSSVSWQGYRFARKPTSVWSSFLSSAVRSSKSTQKLPAYKVQYGYIMNCETMKAKEG